jgi:hypothetical protein
LFNVEADFCLRTKFSFTSKKLDGCLTVHANWRYFEMYDDGEM